MAILSISTALPASAQQTGTIALRELTADIVPTEARAGADRDLDGDGPTMTFGTELTIGRGGRAVFASVIFIARENDGNVKATSIRTAPTKLWRWQLTNGARFVSRILTDPIVATRLSAVPHCAPIGCAVSGPSQNGSPILTLRNMPGYLSTVTYLGDTTGDDISTDQNPHGDTSIRNISFDPIQVEVSSQLGG